MTGEDLAGGPHPMPGTLTPPRAAPCSLNQPTRSRRRLAVVRADIATLGAAAHRHGATTNDAILVAVAGALNQVLMGRGEDVGTLVVTMPVSGQAPRQRARTGQHGQPDARCRPAHR